MKANVHKQKTHSIVENMVAIFIGGAYALVFLFRSPLHPWRGGNSGTDSSVFKTVALMMEKGYVPYKDSFDHKGPLLYIINYWGNKISYYRGIWVVELISLAITVFLMYKIARLLCEIESSIVVTLLATSLLFSYFQGGNLVEEYAMPFIAMAILIFIKYLISNSLPNRFQLVLLGLGFGAVLMLRPNMIVVWLVFCLYIFVRFLVVKAYSEMFFVCKWFVLGISIVVVPIIIWLAANKALFDFWHDYIVFNCLYVSAEGGSAIVSAKWSAFISFAKTTVFMLSSLCLLFKMSKLNFVYFIYLIGTIMLMTMSGKAFGHYGMILIPAYVYPFSVLFADIEKIREDATRRSLIAVCALWLLSSLVVPNMLSLIDGIPSIFENREQKEISQDQTINTIKWYIDKNTEIDDDISVYGNWDIIYVVSKRKHATRYSYQFPIGDVMPSLMDEYWRELGNEQPAIIVVQKGRFDEKMNDFLRAYEYELLWMENEKDNQSAAVYGK